MGQEPQAIGKEIVREFVVVAYDAKGHRPDEPSTYGTALPRVTAPNIATAIKLALEKRIAKNQRVVEVLVIDLTSNYVHRLAPPSSEWEKVDLT